MAAFRYLRHGLDTPGFVGPVHHEPLAALGSRGLGRSCDFAPFGSVNFPAVDLFIKPPAILSGVGPGPKYKQPMIGR